MTDEDKALVKQAAHRAAILHASAAWGSDEDGALINLLIARIEAQAAEIEKLRGELRQIEVDAAETYNDWCEAGCDAKDAIRFAFDIGTYCRAALGETK